MNYNEFKQAVINCAKAQGIDEYDLYFVKGSSTTVMAYEGDIDKFSDSSTIGASFRCMHNGKMGYSNTQKLCAQEAERLVADAKAGAQMIETQGFARIYEGGGSYADIPQADNEACDVEKLKAMALDIEKQAKAKDSRIESVSYAAAFFFSREVGLYNSHGLDLTNRQSGYQLLCQAIAGHQGRKYVGMGEQASLDIDKLDIGQVVGEAVQLAVGSIGGKTIASGEYPIIFSPQIMASLLECFAGVFSADAAQKGLSLLAGKEGEAIASECFSLVDDPHYADSADKTAFDDEGVPTKTKTIIQNGVLKTLLYDLTSAAKAGLPSTGNGRRSGYAGNVNVAPFTLCVEKGDHDLDALMAKAGKGLYITEMKGMHAGANPVTGDFSLESKGMLVENGKLSRPAEQFTVAGNFYQMIKNIIAVGSNFRLCDSVGTPSILFGGLSVAGESAAE